MRVVFADGNVVDFPEAGPSLIEDVSVMASGSLVLWDAVGLRQVAVVAPGKWVYVIPL